MAHSFKSLIISLQKPTSWLLLAMGFSAGLPFLLVGGTLGLWMRQSGLSLSLIGYFSWVTLAYGFKFIWAPLLKRLNLSWLYHYLGQLRSLMILSQLGISLGLGALSLIGPQHLLGFTLAASLTAFFAACQEITIDTWRTLETHNEEQSALNPSLYSLGYRLSLLITNALILFLSKRWGWPLSYGLMAVLMSIGLIAALMAPKSKSEIVTQKIEFIAPFKTLLSEHKGVGVTLIALLMVYRLPDFMIGPVALPLYQDVGLDPDAIALMRATFGLWASFIGVGIGGFCILWLGIDRAFLLGAITVPLAKLLFAAMAYDGHHNLALFGVTLVFDDISNGIAETALIAFITRLCSAQNALTAYALMISLPSLTGKLLKGFSGQIIDSFTPHLGLMGAYQAFFIGTALIGMPVIWLILRFMGKYRSSPASS